MEPQANVKLGYGDYTGFDSGGGLYETADGLSELRVFQLYCDGEMSKWCFYEAMDELMSRVILTLGEHPCIKELSWGDKWAISKSIPNGDHAVALDLIRGRTNTQNEGMNHAGFVGLLTLSYGYKHPTKVTQFLRLANVPEMTERVVVEGLSEWRGKLW